MLNKRKGFTLVELLIVIVVIGILSAMMMLSSTEATTSARASNIVSNLRNLKTAALAFYADNLDHFNKTLAPETEPKFEMKQIVPYMKAGTTATTYSSTNDPEFDGYACNADATHWYIGYGPIGDSRIKDKLDGRKNALQLLGSSAIGNAPATTTTTYNKDNNCVWVLVLDMAGTTTTP